MDRLLKLADVFVGEVEKPSLTKDVFEDLSLHRESKVLSQIAGKILYKANKEQDPKTAEKLRHAGKLILAASDLLK